MPIYDKIRPDHPGLVCTVCGLATAVYTTPWMGVMPCDNNDCIVDAFRENCEKLWDSRREIRRHLDSI